MKQIRAISKKKIQIWGDPVEGKSVTQVYQVTKLPGILFSCNVSMNKMLQY